MSADRLLQNLSKVRQTGKSKWLALCPAHADKSPSLAIAEGDDGRVLIKCFGGCDTRSVLQSVGLDWGDIFDAMSNTQQCGVNRKARLISAADALSIIYESTLFICVVGADIQKNRDISDHDFEHLGICCSRIARCMEGCHV